MSSDDIRVLNPGEHVGHISAAALELISDRPQTHTGHAAVGGTEVELGFHAGDVACLRRFRTRQGLVAVAAEHIHMFRRFLENLRIGHVLA